MSAAARNNRGAPRGPRGKEIAPGVRKWGEHWYGTKESLIASAKPAGILRDGDFPGDKGQRASYAQVERDGWKIYMQSSTPSTPPTFRVEIIETPEPADMALAKTIEQIAARAQKDYKRSQRLRERDLGKAAHVWETHRAICRGRVNGCDRKAHGWCVDLIGTPDELVAAKLALPEWFRGNKECRRVLCGGREIEVYLDRTDGDRYELSIPYRKGDAWRRGAGAQS